MGARTISRIFHYARIFKKGRSELDLKVWHFWANEGHRMRARFGCARAVVSKVLFYDASIWFQSGSVCILNVVNDEEILVTVGLSGLSSRPKGPVFKRRRYTKSLSRIKGLKTKSLCCRLHQLRRRQHWKISDQPVDDAIAQVRRQTILPRNIFQSESPIYLFWKEILPC